MPIVLVLGQIASDLKVGERKREKDINKIIFIYLFKFKKLDIYKNSKSKR